MPLQYQDYILLILNCKKYTYKADHQKNTWLKTIPASLLYYHIIGDENLNETFIFDEPNHILYVKTKDDYNSLPHKIIAAFNAITAKYKFKYIFKTDDDQILIKPDFFKTLMNLLQQTQESHYGGYPIHCNDHISQYYIIHNELPKNILLKKTTYCNGRFYFLSNSAINHLLTKTASIEKEYLEDYAIGYHLDDVYKQKLLVINNGTIFKDILFGNS